MREKTIKRLTLLSLMSALRAFSQTAAPTLMDVPKFNPSSAPIPKHLVYQHFLAMVNDLNTKSLQSGETDPYKFAQPFSRAGLENADLDVLRDEANALASDLAALDAQAAPLILAYRNSAKAAAQLGQPIPPSPSQLYQLQATRTAISVNHMMTLQSKLGKQKTGKLENYLAREVTPRVSLKSVAHPPVAPDDVVSGTAPPQ